MTLPFTTNPNPASQSNNGQGTPQAESSYPNIRRSTKQSSYANVRSALGQAPTGTTYQTSSGATATTSGGSKYSNVREALGQSASIGTPTTNSPKVETSKPVSPQVKALFQGQITPEQFSSGQFQNVAISGGVYGQLNQMSVRQDLNAQGNPIFQSSILGNSRHNLNLPMSNNLSGGSNGNINNSNNNWTFNVPLSNNQNEKKGFENRVEAISNRQNDFLNGQGMKNIQDTANFLTFGKGQPLLSRSSFGQVSEMVTTGFLSSGIGLGAGLVNVGEKISAVGEGLYLNSGDTFNELFINAPKNLEKTSFSFLPGGTPINNQGISTLVSAGIGAGISLPSFKTNFVTRSVLEKTYPDVFVKSDSLNIKFVEDVTEPTSLNVLKQIENKQVTTIHVTTSDIFNGKDSFITTAQDSGAGGFRNQNKLLNFYKSSPVPSDVTEGRAYLGYAGIKSDVNSFSSGKVVFGNPTVKVLVFEDVISPTPSNIVGGGLLDINAFQVGTSGKTFIPAENLMRMSTEGQVITPSSYKDVSGASRFGLDNSKGSLISKNGQSKFTYYGQDRSSSFLGKVFGKKYYKFEIIPSKTSSVSSDLILGSKVSEVDLVDYNLNYGSKSYKSSPSFVFSNLSSLSFSNFKGSSSSNRSSFGSSLSLLSSGSRSLLSSGLSSKSSSLSSSSSRASSSVSLLSSGLSSKSSSLSSSLSSLSSSSSLLSSSSSIKSSKSSSRSSSSSSYSPTYSSISDPSYFFSSKKESRKRKVLNSFKPMKVKRSSSGVYALADLRSVFITEAKTGREAVMPLLRGKTRGLVMDAYKGYGSGFVPTRQMQNSKGGLK